MIPQHLRHNPARPLIGRAHHLILAGLTGLVLLTPAVAVGDREKPQTGGGRSDATQPAGTGKEERVLTVRPAAGKQVKMRILTRDGRVRDVVVDKDGR